MPLDPATRERIAGLIEAHPVMLFMKGTPDAPGCGFSAQVVSILSGLVPQFGSCNVLEDPEVRQGIKEYSDWPTIPQLYIRGEFMGGCDIVKEMYATGELHAALGVEAPKVEVPEISISEAAAEMIRGAQAQSQHPDLHVVIDARFQHQLGFGPRQPGEIEAQAAGLTLLLDRDSASRANGLQIDVVAGPDGQQGLAVNNPNAPDHASGAVNQLPPAELRALMESGAELFLFDVRTQEEHDTARIEGARLVDESVAAEIEKLPRHVTLVFHCHHGGRSQAAAEHFVSLGFTDVHNLAGGIDAWSVDIDPDVPRY